MRFSAKIATHFDEHAGSLSTGGILTVSPSSTRPVAVVTGASAGLGLAIAQRFIVEGYDVVGIGRDAGRLESAASALAAEMPQVHLKYGRFTPMTANVIDAGSVKELFRKIQCDFGRVDVLINCVGQSDRGSVVTLSRERLMELMDSNVVSALLCSQSALPLLQVSRGVIVNVGSLASKVGARHLGAYPATKHALAGLTQQMRLEWREYGIQVALLSPGPIRRDDAGKRYSQLSTAAGVPAEALQPGGGSSLRGLEPKWIAEEVVRCVKRRSPDVVLPRYARLMITLGHLFPRLGDRILLALTGRGQ